MTTYLRAALALVLTSALLACSNNPTVVSTDFVALDYSKHTRFAWFEGDMTRHSGVTDIGHQRIQENIVADLQGKGFTLVEPAEADLIVNYSVVAREKVDINTYQVYDGYAPGFTWNRDHGAIVNKTREEYTETQVEEYYEGTLIVDILDAGNNQIVWRGVGRKRLSEEMDKEARDRLIKEVVSSVMKNFPPES